MNTIEYYREYVKAFKKQLSIIDKDFLREHISGHIFRELIRYRDPSNDWISHQHVPELDEDAISLIGINTQNKMYLIMHSDMIDYYLYGLVSSFRVNIADTYPYDEVSDKKILQERIFEWRKDIPECYNRLEHIKVFVWNLLRTERDLSIKKMVEDYVLETFDLGSCNFSEFYHAGMIFEIKSNVSRIVKLKAITSIWGNYTKYGKGKNYLSNQEYLSIPEYIDPIGLIRFTVVEIGKSVFDSLSETRVISLPRTIKNIEWSFWECRKLEKIEVNNFDYEMTSFKSIDGVLYSKDGDSLCAYPNNHGNTYEIPDGVVTIRKFAFKSCDSIQTLILPSSLRRIETNAFYRCTNLKRIICYMKPEELTFEGFIGDYGEVNPEWFFICNNYNNQNNKVLG